LIALPFAAAEGKRMSSEGMKKIQSMKMLRSFACAASLFVLTASGVQAAGSGDETRPPVAERLGLAGMSRIIGGVAARRGDWPWQVAIYDRSSFSCGGSIIADTWVLTAAHCVTDDKQNTLGPDNFIVVEGTWNIVNETARLDSLPEGRALRVKRVIPHEKYQMGMRDNSLRIENDIALLELAEPARSAPIPYADSQSATAETPNTVATNTGWGKIRGYKRTESGPVDPETGKPITAEEFKEKYETTRLMQVDMPVVSIEQCQTAYRNGYSKMGMDQRQLCAGLPEGGKSACNGDSGGPLVARNENGFVQIGVTSFVADNTLCALPGLPAVYTRISAYEPWLREKTSVNQGAASVETQTVANNIGGSNGAALSVSFVQGASIRIGQKIQFRVSAQKPGYLVLLDIGPSGSVTQIFPNPFSIQSRLTGLKTSGWIDATQPLIIPDSKNLLQNFDVTAAAPAGRGKLVAVLSDRPIEQFHTSANQVVMARKFRSFETRAKALSALGVLARTVQHDLSVEPGVLPPSVAIAEYMISE
jgi:secreted trypsin-like serine protease